jgi:hypothetical protein
MLPTATITDIKNNAPICYGLMMSAGDLLLEQLYREGFSLWYDTEDREGCTEMADEIFREVRTSYVNKQNLLPEVQRKMPEEGKSQITR